MIRIDAGTHTWAASKVCNKVLAAESRIFQPLSKYQSIAYYLNFGALITSPSLFAATFLGQSACRVFHQFRHLHSNSSLGTQKQACKNNSKPRGEYCPQATLDPSTLDDETFATNDDPPNDAIYLSELAKLRTSGATQIHSW